jgi:organic radical activating enzyme
MITNLDNNKYLKWIVTNKCNYNCSYCFEKNFKSIELSNEDLFLTANKINEFMKINNLNSLILLGGELFLLDTNIILKLLEILKGKKLYIITNFFQDNLLYKKVADFSKDNFSFFEYKFSFHDEYISLKDFFNKIDDFKKICNCNIKAQFTLDERTEKLLSEFELRCCKSKVKYHIEKAYTIYGKNRENVKFSNVKSKTNKIFLIDDKKIEGDILFKNGPLDNYGTNCYQPFFHLESNKLYSHCYGRTITNDFLNYNVEKIDFNFICNRHSCLIYKTSIIQKIS